MVMWCILKWLFNFDMFSGHQWNILLHAQLRGFAGFVFGILILASIPLYIATTSIILRTKKPLIPLSVPKFMQPVPDETAATESATTHAAAAAPQPEQPQTPEKPQKIIPTELRPAFTRARAHGGSAPKSVFDLSNIAAPHTSPVSEQQPELQPADTLPLPNDFNVTPTAMDNTVPTFTPVFSDPDFDDVAPDASTESHPTTPQQPTPPPDIAQNPTDITPVIEYLTARGDEFSVDGDIIFTATAAIAAHNDPDFWIADDENWFAAGKQKPSPADAVLAAAAVRGVRPILFLGQTNIMDLDARRAQWARDGITVITNLNELK